jgi:hypothetical protein
LAALGIVGPGVRPEVGIVSADETNPFAVRYGIVMDGTDRLHMVKSFTAEQCRAALSNEELWLQKGVRLALERRLCKVAKDHK